MDRCAALEARHTPATRDDMVRILRDLCREGAVARNGTVADATLRDRTVCSYLKILKTQLSSQRRATTTTASRVAACASVRSMLSFYSMLISQIAVKYSRDGDGGGIKVTESLDPRLVFNTDPTHLVASADTGHGRSAFWTVRGSKNVKVLPRSGGKTMPQSVKLVSTCSAAGSLSEIVILKKVTTPGFVGNVGGRPGVWRAKLPDLHPAAMYPGISMCGHLWIYHSLQCKEGGRPGADAQFCADYHELIFEPFLRGARESVSRARAGAAGPAVHLFDGEAAWLGFAQSEKHQLTCERENLVLLKTSAARTASEQPFDVSPAFLTLKSLFRGNIDVRDVERRGTADLKPFQDAIRKLKISEGRKAMLKSVVPRLYPAIERAFSPQAIKKGFADSGAYPVGTHKGVSCFDRVGARCSGWQRTSTDEEKRIKALLPSFVDMFKAKGFITEDEFNKHNIPQDENYDPKALPKDLQVEHRQRAKVLNHRDRAQHLARASALKQQMRDLARQKRAKEASEKQIEAV